MIESRKIELNLDLMNLFFFYLKKNKHILISLPKQKLKVLFFD